MVSAAFGLVAVGATTASADTVSARWGCARPLGPSGSFDGRFTVTAPANVTRGQTVTLSVSVFNTVPAGTFTPAGTLRGQLEIVVGGAGSGLILANDMVNPDIPASQPKGLNGHVSYTFNTSGNVTFRPQLIRFYDQFGNVNEICGNSATPIAATTHVS